MKSILIFCSITVLLLSSCLKSKEIDTSSISKDEAVIAEGKLKFSQTCSTCHSFEVDAIGPLLGGITRRNSSEWIKAFIKDPQGKLESGDAHVKEMFEKFKVPMPSFSYFSEEDLNALVAYMHTKNTPDSSSSFLDPNALRNPFPPIAMSNLVVNLELLTQIPPSSETSLKTRITKLVQQPKSNELFVVDINGVLYHLNGKNPEAYLDLRKLKSNLMNRPGWATGFGSFAFHPDFLKNGLLYTSHSENPNSAKADFEFPDSVKVALQWVVTEWKTNTPTANSFSGQEREILRVNMVGTSHGMQEITFNPTSKPGEEDYGLLYIGIGDGGSAERDLAYLCHSTEKIWGTILRIDPKGRDSKNGKYGIPKTNPFVKNSNERTATEIFAYGFRNPHRITWSQSGQMLVPNIGQHNIESLCIVEAGDDFGWPVREGSFVIDLNGNRHNIYPLPQDDKKNNFTYPVAMYDHDEGNAISGGFEYTGEHIPELKGKFVFGDIVQGRLFYVEMADLKKGNQAQIKEWQVSFEGRIQTLKELTGAGKVDERFGRDSEGELYITTKPDGKVYKLISATIK
jgi:glucose/arabinose dehydrogenase/cytochrome c2